MIGKFKTSIDSVGGTILQMVKETFRRKFALPGFSYLTLTGFAIPWISIKVDFYLILARKFYRICFL